MAANCGGRLQPRLRDRRKHKPNPRRATIVASDVIAELVQRVCLNNEDPKKVLGETAR